MKPYYEKAGIVIYHGDCRDILPTLGPSLRIVSDPPYGMNWAADGALSGGAGHQKKNNRTRIVGDNEPFDPAPLLCFSEVTLWGYQHYAQRLPAGSTLVWVKKNLEKCGKVLSDAELAWEKGGVGVYVKWSVWDGCARESEHGDHYHPTQKPVNIMRWFIERGNSLLPICDPYVGSGSTLVAAKQLGRAAIGIEIEEKYCEIAALRLSQEVMNFEEAV